MVIRRGEQLHQALHLQEVTEWSIAGQLARVNVGHLEEGEVACHLHQVEEMLIQPERRGLSPIEPSSRNRERNLQQRLVLRKRYKEATAYVEYLKSVDCFGWGPGITEF